MRSKLRTTRNTDLDSVTVSARLNFPTSYTFAPVSFRHFVTYATPANEWSYGRHLEIDPCPNSPYHRCSSWYDNVIALSDLVPPRRKWKWNRPVFSPCSARNAIRSWE